MRAAAAPFVPDQAQKGQGLSQNDPTEGSSFLHVTDWRQVRVASRYHLERAAGDASNACSSQKRVRMMLEANDDADHADDNETRGIAASLARRVSGKDDAEKCEDDFSSADEDYHEVGNIDRALSDDEACEDDWPDDTHDQPSHDERS